MNRSKNIIPINGQQNLETYKGQVDRLNNSELAKLYIQANPSIRIFVISAYSLLCFLGGLWFYHTNNANSDLKLRAINSKLNTVIKKHEDVIKGYSLNQKSINDVLKKIKVDLNQSNYNLKDLKKSIVHMKTENSQGLIDIKGPSIDFSYMNDQFKSEKNINIRHSKLRVELDKRQKIERDEFKELNDIASSKGLKAWKKFTYDQLREKRALDSIIRNERKLFY